MKKLLIASLTFVLIISFSACLGNPDHPDETISPTVTATVIEETSPTTTPIPTATATLVPSPSPTIAPTATPEPTPVPNAPTDILSSGTKIYASGGGRGTVNFDLNGDGTDDVITFEFFGFGGPVPEDVLSPSSPYIVMMDYDIYQCNLEVNGQPIIIQGEVMAGLVLIGDIDSGDSQYEIMIPEFGPSGDPATTFIAYSGVAPQNIGKLYSNPFNDLKVDGSNLITGTKRGAKLHTWFYDAEYTLDGGLIEEIKENGLVLMDTDVTAKVDLPLQMSPTDPTHAFTLSAGESATITWTDDERWFCIEKSGGLKGWFEISGFYMIGGLPATDIFDGLLMAD